MHGKNTVKYQFFNTVFLVTFVMNATWLDIILLNISPLKNYDQTMTKNGEKSQENVKCLNTRFDNFPYFAI